MFAPDVTNTVLHWPFLPKLVRLALALGTGAFVGFPHQDTLGQGAPGLEQNRLGPAIFHSSLPTIGVARRILVERNAELDKAVVQQAHLHLVRHQGLRQKGLEIFHLEPVLVGNAEVAHLARKAEFLEGFSDFLPFPKGVGRCSKRASKWSVPNRVRIASTLSRRWSWLKSKRCGDPGGIIRPADPAFRLNHDLVP
jgi:hypothetical protein